MGRLWDDWGGPAESEDGPPTKQLKPPPAAAPQPSRKRSRSVDLDAPDRVLGLLEEPKKPAT